MVTSANFPAPDPVPTITPTTTPTAVASTTAAAETQLTSRLLKDGPKPKHAQLREILEEICATELSPGDMLPGERVLEETYGVSRITVRRAIGDLVASGKLKRARGKGTFVAPNPLVSRLHLASFSSEMSAQHLQASSKILQAARAMAPEEISAFFNAEPGVMHTHLRRLRLGDNRPYARCIPSLTSITKCLSPMPTKPPPPYAPTRKHPCFSTSRLVHRSCASFGSPFLKAVLWNGAPRSTELTATP